jgi:hypothetical protein
MTAWGDRPAAIIFYLLRSLSMDFAVPAVLRTFPCRIAIATISLVSPLPFTAQSAIANPVQWETHVASDTAATITHPAPTLETPASDNNTSTTSTSAANWGNTPVALLIQASQSPTLQALINTPTIASNFEQLGENLSLEIDGTIVERGRKISTATGLALTLAQYFDQDTIPQTIVIHSNGQPVFLSRLATTAQGTTIRSQFLNQTAPVQTTPVQTTPAQTAPVQTLHLPADRTMARGVLGALSIIGLAPDNAQTINAFIGDLAATPQLTQHFTKLLIDLQGLNQNASDDRINALITSYNRIMKTADSATIDRLSQNPNFRALSSLLQKLSQSGTQRSAIGRNPSKAREAAAEEGFVYTGLGVN